MKKRSHFADLSLPRVFVRLFRGVGVWLSLGFLAALAGVIVFGRFASEMREGETLRFDDSVRESVHQIATPFVTQLMIWISFLGSTIFLTAVGVVVFSLLLYFKWKRETAIFLIAMAGQIVLHLGLKAYYNRARPDPFFGYTIPASSSFPSGHALASLSFYAILAWFVINHVERPLLKWLIGVGVGILILAIGFSRVYLGVHYPSDVIAGFLAAGVWTLTVIIADAFLHRDHDNSNVG